MEKLDCIGYLAPDGLEKQVLDGLTHVTARYDRLILADGPLQAATWAQNIWLTPLLIPITSIGDGVKKLRSFQRNWAYYPCGTHHRRASLISKQLPYVSTKPLPFGSVLPQITPQTQLGSWTLLDPQTILASPGCSSPFPNGELSFEECKADPPAGPPGRAYLKLWESLTLLRKFPQKGEHCLELGASPGSWTWVLAKLGADVLAVDRAPLDPAIAAMSGVKFQKGDGFSIKPEDVERVDWIFSDIICYPEKLLSWVKMWVDSGKCRNFVCTIKFQGAEHYKMIPEFAAIPGSKVIHLFHNKHELTWMLQN